MAKKSKKTVAQGVRKADFGQRVTFTAPAPAKIQMQLIAAAEYLSRHPMFAGRRWDISQFENTDIPSITFDFTEAEKRRRPVDHDRCVIDGESGRFWTVEFYTLVREEPIVRIYTGLPTERHAWRNFDGEDIAACILDAIDATTRTLQAAE